MRHKRLNKKFDRNKPERDSMMNNLVRGLFISQSITTTTQKAKEARRFAEKLITMAKTNDVHSRRKVFAHMRDKALTKKLFAEIVPLFKDRKGGYTRIIKLGKRRGDNADLSILELTEKKVVATKTKSKKKEKPAESKPAAPEKAGAKETTPHAPEKPKEVTHEKHIPPKKEEKEIHPGSTHKAPAGGFVGTLRKFFRGRTK